MDLFNKKRVDELENVLHELEETVHEEIANRQEIRNEISEMRHEISEMRHEISEMRQSIEDIHEEMEGYKKYKTEKELLKESDEPWADFEVFIEDDGRTGVKMDWNKHFIEELKKQGINASTEEEIMSIYFASLVREQGNEISEQEAEKYT